MDVEKLERTLDAIKDNLYMVFIALCALIGLVGAIGYKLVGS